MEHHTQVTDSIPLIHLKDGMIEEKFPSFLQDVGMLKIWFNSYQIGRSLNESGFTNLKLNQVLLNEYSNGKGISPHQDGALYHSFAAVLSLESPAIIEFYKEKINFVEYKKTLDTSEKCVMSLVLQPRSLLVFTDEVMV